MTEQEQLQLFKKYVYIRKGKVNNTGRLSCRNIPKEDYLKFEEIFDVEAKAFHRNKGFALKPKCDGRYIIHIFKGKENVQYTCSSCQRLLFSKYDLPHIKNIDDFVVEEVMCRARVSRKLFSSAKRDYKLIKF